MKTFTLWAGFGAIITALAAPPQRVFNAPVADTGKPVTIQAEDESLTVFKHEDFPSHEVRAVQPTGFCDSTVQQWSGYLDTPSNRHLYFW